MTEEEEIRSIGRLSQHYKHILININTYVGFLQFAYENIDSVQQLDVLKRGLYGYIGESSIWVGKMVAPGTLHISNLDVTNAKEIGKWSISIPIHLATPEYIERVLNLKAFW